MSEQNNRGNPHWGEVLQNLGVFLDVSGTLVKHLESLMNSPKTTETSQPQKPKSDSNLCCSCPSKEGLKPLGDPGYNTFQNNLPVPLGLQPSSTPNRPSTNFKIYEDPESSEQLKGSNKPRSKQCPVAKSQSNKLGPKASKEQLGHLGKLKEDLRTAQNHLILVDEQVRKMERLLQDFDSTSISGKVNPSALYREIVKPDFVPYRSNSSTPQQQRLPFQSLGNTTNQSSQCTPCGGGTRLPLPALSPPNSSYYGFDAQDMNLQDQQRGPKSGNKSGRNSNQQNREISILSAAPLDQNTIDSCLSPSGYRKLK